MSCSLHHAPYYRRQSKLQRWTQLRQLIAAISFWTSTCPKIETSSFDEGIVSTLFNVLPGIRSISFDDLFLAFRFDRFPPKPWPKTIASLPIYLTVEKDDFGPLDKLVSNRVPSKVCVLPFPAILN